MRSIIKTANRFDSIWTTLVMAPAFIVLLNAGIGMQNGTASQADFSRAAETVAVQFADQYTPYVETTGDAIVAGVQKLASTASSCVSGSKPIYLSGGMVHKNGCALGNKFARVAPVRPYRGY